VQRGVLTLELLCFWNSVGLQLTYSINHTVVMKVEPFAVEQVSKWTDTFQYGCNLTPYLVDGRV